MRARGIAGVFLLLGVLASGPAAAQGESAITTALGASGGAALGAGVGLAIWNPFLAHQADIDSQSMEATRHPMAYLWPTFASLGVGLVAGALAGALLPPTATVQIVEIGVLVAALLGDGLILAVTRVRKDPPEHFEIGALSAHPPPGIASSPAAAPPGLRLALRF